MAQRIKEEVRVFGCGHILKGRLLLQRIERPQLLRSRRALRSMPWVSVQEPASERVLSEAVPRRRRDRATCVCNECGKTLL